jgi:hypothetical protein
MKNQVTEHAEETQSIAEFFSVSLCAISVNLCVPNLDFFSALLGDRSRPPDCQHLAGLAFPLGADWASLQAPIPADENHPPGRGFGDAPASHRML